MLFFVKQEARLLKDKARLRSLAVRSEEEELTLKAVEAALTRISLGTYYNCQGGCEGSISPERLAAIPWSACCKECAKAKAKKPTSQATVSPRAVFV